MTTIYDRAQKRARRLKRRRGWLKWKWMEASVQFFDTDRFFSRERYKSLKIIVASEGEKERKRKKKRVQFIDDNWFSILVKSLELLLPAATGEKKSYNVSTSMKFRDKNWEKKRKKVLSSFFFFFYNIRQLSNDKVAKKLGRGKRREFSDIFDAEVCYQENSERFETLCVRKMRTPRVSQGRTKILQPQTRTFSETRETRSHTLAKFQRKYRRRKIYERFQSLHRKKGKIQHSNSDELFQRKNAKISRSLSLRAWQFFRGTFD